MTRPTPAWCSPAVASGVQGVFQHVKGVSNAVSGYIGGSAADALRAGQQRPDRPRRSSEDRLRPAPGQLRAVDAGVLLGGTRPDQLNRQGRTTAASIDRQSSPMTPASRQPAAPTSPQLGQAGSYRAPIVTQLVSGQRFYPAESYHQNYMANYPQAFHIRYSRRTGSLRRWAAVPGAARARRWCRCGSRRSPGLTDARRCSSVEPSPRSALLAECNRAWARLYTQKDARPSSRAFGKYRPCPDQARPTTTC